MRLGTNGEGQLMLLQDILDECVNGWTEGHGCPFCGKGIFEVDLHEGGLTLRCPACLKFFEGQF